MKLHKNATTTPAVRKQIQKSSESVAALAKHFGVHETTIRRWKKRATQQDGPHTRHRRPVSLSPLEEQLVVAQRQPAFKQLCYLSLPATPGRQ